MSEVQNKSLFFPVEILKIQTYTGKNEEWNLAFEKFIGAGPDVDNPVLWVAFGKEDLEELLIYPL